MILFKVNGSIIWKVCNTRNNNVDRILVSYKTTNNERIEQGYCFEIMYVITVCHYIAANNEVLLNKKILFI